MPYKILRTGIIVGGTVRTRGDIVEDIPSPLKNMTEDEQVIKWGEIVYMESDEEPDEQSVKDTDFTDDLLDDSNEDVDDEEEVVEEPKPKKKKKKKKTKKYTSEV